MLTLTPQILDRLVKIHWASLVSKILFLKGIDLFKSPKGQIFGSMFSNHCFTKEDPALLCGMLL